MGFGSVVGNRGVAGALLLINALAMASALGSLQGRWATLAMILGAGSDKNEQRGCWGLNRENDLNALEAPSLTR